MGVIHPQATTEDLIKGHIEGKNAYDLAEEYGMDEEQIKTIIHELDEQGVFIPKQDKKEK